VKFALLVKNIWFFFFCRVKFALLVKNTWFFFFCRAKFTLICEKYMVPFFLQSEIRIVSHEFFRIIPTVFKITKYSLRILQNFFTRVIDTYCLKKMHKHYFLDHTPLILKKVLFLRVTLLFRVGTVIKNNALLLEFFTHVLAVNISGIFAGFKSY